jgi:DNA-binding transcriptional LysR family regulator
LTVHTECDDATTMRAAILAGWGISLFNEETIADEPGSLSTRTLTSCPIRAISSSSSTSPPAIRMHPSIPW